MPKFKTWTLFPLIALGMLFMNCSCDFFGTAGGLFIPEAKEAQLGASFDSTLRHTPDGQKEFPIFNPGNNPDSQAFVNYVVGLAKSVEAQIPAKDMPEAYGFTYTIIDKDVENAFAVPGGYVYIYTGIIKKMEDEAELAGVLGHEIAHVTWHHYRDALAKTAGMGVLLDVLLGDDAGQLAQVVAGSLFQLAALSVTRGNEKEADFHGTLYSGGAGRNPRGIAEYFSRVKGMGFTWISSHPGPEDRVKTVNAQVDANPSLKAIADSAHDFRARFLEKTAVIR
jgi:predicted Zn-dependent protease